MVPSGKQELDTVNKAPIAHVNGIGTPIVQLDVFVTSLARQWGVHDFVDDNVMGQQRGCTVSATGCLRIKCMKHGSSVWKATGRHTVDLGVKAHGIDDMCQTGRPEKDLVATCAQREAQGCLVKGYVVPGLQNCTGRYKKLVRSQRVAQAAS